MKKPSLPFLQRASFNFLRILLPRTGCLNHNCLILINAAPGDRAFNYFRPTGEGLSQNNSPDSVGRMAGKPYYGRDIAQQPAEKDGKPLYLKALADPKSNPPAVALSHGSC